MHRIEDRRARQKREKTRVRVQRWRQKKVETEERKVTKGPGELKHHGKPKKLDLEGSAGEKKIWCQDEVKEEKMCEANQRQVRENIANYEILEYVSQ